MTHVQRIARVALRSCAALTALWLVVCGVLSLLHQSQVAHVRDSETGAMMHATAVVDGGTSGERAIHDRHDSSHDDGPCTLGSLHEASPPSTSRGDAERPTVYAVGAIVAVSQVARCVDRVFLLAPKTSPPSV